MAISCVYCGGQHETSAAVRECWSKSQLQPGRRWRGPCPDWAATSSSGPDNRPLPIGRQRHDAHVGSAEVNDPTRPGFAAARQWPTTAFRACSRSATWLPKRSTLQQTNTAPLHQVGPRFTFERSELHHLVWSNSIDGRDDNQSVWHLTDRAVALGATPAEHDVAGDVVLADGTAVWLDGGPIRFTAPDRRRPGDASHCARAPLAACPSRSNASTADLADDQLAAVTHAGGASRVIAPAGSGKTTRADRTSPSPADAMAAAAELGVPGGVQQARPGGDERAGSPTCRGLQVRTLNAIALAIVNGSAPFAAQPTT